MESDQSEFIAVWQDLAGAESPYVDAGLVDRSPEQLRLADPLFAHYIRGKITTVFV